MEVGGCLDQYRAGSTVPNVTRFRINLIEMKNRVQLQVLKRIGRIDTGFRCRVFIGVDAYRRGKGLRLSHS